MTWTTRLGTASGIKKSGSANRVRRPLGFTVTAELRVLKSLPRRGVIGSYGADTDGRKILSPFDKRECVSLQQAADIAGKSESTLRGWCDVHGLGRRVGGGTWSVSKVALAMFLDGDIKAL